MIADNQQIVHKCNLAYPARTDLAFALLLENSVGTSNPIVVHMHCRDIVCSLGPKKNWLDS